MWSRLCLEPFNSHRANKRRQYNWWELEGCAAILSNLNSKLISIRTGVRRDIIFYLFHSTPVGSCTANAVISCFQLPPNNFTMSKSSILSSKLLFREHSQAARIQVQVCFNLLAEKPTQHIAHLLHTIFLNLWANKRSISLLLSRVCSFVLKLATKKPRLRQSVIIRLRKCLNQTHFCRSF